MRAIPLLAALLSATLSVGVANAEPDISGPWIAPKSSGVLTADGGGAPPLLPAAQIQYTKIRSLPPADRNDPAGRCLPPGTPRTMLQPYPFGFVQGHTMIAQLFEWNHLNRIIHLTQAHSETIGPLYFGQSIGHWEGDTLVVDSNSYNGTTWLDDTGLPHSDQLHTTERIGLADRGTTLQDQITFDDPSTYSHSWSTMMRFHKQPGAIIKEDYCLGRRGLNKLNSVAQ